MEQYIFVDNNHDRSHISFDSAQVRCAMYGHELPFHPSLLPRQMIMGPLVGTIQAFGECIMDRNL